MFEKAEGYGNYRNAPASFVKKFDWNASQVQMDIVNKADETASAKRSAKVEKAFATGNEQLYKEAQAEYEARMKEVREFRNKLSRIQSKFFS